MMSITIFGVLIIAYCFYVLLCKKNNKAKFIHLFILSVFLYFNITIGYVVKIGNQTIAGYFLVTLLAGAMALLLVKKVSIKLFIEIILLLAVIVAAIGLIPIKQYQIVDQNGWDWYLFGANNITTCKLGFEQIKELIKALSFLMILSVIYTKIGEEDWIYIINKIIKWSKYVICYGIFEFVMVYIFRFYNLYSALLLPIFGIKESTYIFSMERGSGHQLQGLFTEPSSYSTGLFFIVLLFLMQLKYCKEGKNPKKANLRNIWIWIGICMVLMVLSMAFTAILYLCFLAIIFVLFCYKNMPKMRSIIISSIGMITGLCIIGGYILLNSNTYYGERLRYALIIFKETLNNNDFGNLYFYLSGVVNDGSSISRLGSSIGILKMEFVQNIWCGLGIGVGNSHSLASNMLTDLGIFGTFLWGKLVIGGYKAKKNIYFYVVFFMFILVSFLCQPISMFGTDVIVLIFIFVNIFTSYVSPDRKK